jgi:hypothetical protein
MTNQVIKLKKRLLQGTKAKCIDGRWSADGLPLPERLLVVGYTRGLQCWRDGELLDELDEREGPLPDVDELNAPIPREEWETGRYGGLKPPWALAYVIHLIDPQTAELYTFINTTIGARIAYERLIDKLEVMRRLHGVNVTALVKPDSRPMKTKDVGTKQRPEFTILDWRELPPTEPQPTRLPPPIESQKTTTNEPPWDDEAELPAATATAKPSAPKNRHLSASR